MERRGESGQRSREHPILNIRPLRAEILQQLISIPSLMILLPTKSFTFWEAVPAGQISGDCLPITLKIFISTNRMILSRQKSTCGVSVIRTYYLNQVKYLQSRPNLFSQLFKRPIITDPIRSRKKIWENLKK